VTVRHVATLAALLALALSVGPAAALPGGPQAAAERSELDPNVLRIDEPRHLGTRLDPDLVLRDAQGRAFRLGDLYGKPLILVLSYFGCDGVCPTIARNLERTLEGVERFRPGRDFRVLTVSFDRHDTPERARAFLARSRARAMPGWTVAVLADPADIRRLTEAVGYRYFWSVQDRMFVHPNAYVVLSPEGRVVRYLYGLRIGPRDLELALIDANWERITESGRVLDIVAGVCFSYSYADGRYVLNYPLFAGMGALALGVGLVTFSLLAYRRRRQGRVGHA